MVQARSAPRMNPAIRNFNKPRSTPLNYLPPTTTKKGPFNNTQDTKVEDMPPPSPITIATGSLNRLVKEEGSYHKELKSQEARLEKLLASTEEDENKEYSLKQERTAIAETKAVFAPLNLRIEDALHKLEDLVEGGSGSEEEVVKAKVIIENAKVVIEQAKGDAK